MEGTCFESDWAAMAAGLSGLRSLLGRLHQAGSDRLGPMFAELDELKMLTEAGAGRGAAGPGAVPWGCPGLGGGVPAGWVRQWGRSYLAGGAAGLVRVAVAIGQERNRVLREAVLARAGAGAQRGGGAGRDGQAAAPVDPGVRASTVLGGFVALAEGQGPREIRALRPALIARYGRLGEFQRREDRLKHGVALSQPFDDDGMAEYRLRLDPEGSAVLEAILGPLAAPQPSTEHGSDLRTSDQRRADALVEVCRRAAAAGGSAPATAKAAVVVTMGYQDLLERTGAGTTLTGELLAPETVRKMACDAAIIPVVLGSKGEVLDLGRTVRLATPKQVQALWIRDQGCTFPGCSRPPAWCVAHHVWHWCDGGPTDLSNLALLCPRHHTIVHQRGYTATVTALGVTWHL